MKHAIIEGFLFNFDMFCNFKLCHGRKAGMVFVLL